MDKDEVLDALSDMAEALEDLSRAIWKVIELAEADE